MYESHFGFTGSPFQLNPDPSFYFDSRGHSNALAYLKFGAHQGEGFIVVTGEIGAGKTTLVRTLLEGLNPEQVVAAQVVSTQLESSELLQAILMAFGVPSSSTSKAHLIASLEAFLTALAAKGRRALLIIDEAQNLKHEAVEELRMLSNFQLGKYGLLQSFLVGQPELRGLLQSKSMEQLRQRVIASCHLGPLDEAETRAYVEHRLKCVGWKGSSPTFAPGALDNLYRWTGGVPRKINRLCNRMLLGAFLSNSNAISAALVDETAAELRSEIGEASGPAPSTQIDVVAVTPSNQPATILEPMAAAATATTMEDTTRPTAVSGQIKALGSGPRVLQPATEQDLLRIKREAAPRTSTIAEPLRATGEAAAQTAAHPEPSSVSSPPAVNGAGAPAPNLLRANPSPRQKIRRVHAKGLSPQGALLCVVDSTSSYLRAGLLQSIFSNFPSLPPVIALHLGDSNRIDHSSLEGHGFPLPAMGIHLGVRQSNFATRAGPGLEALNEVWAEVKPQCMMVMGSSDDDLTCALLASKRGTRVLRVGSGRRDAHASGQRALNAVLIERLAHLHFTDSTKSFYALHREGIHLDRVRSVGNLTKEALDLAQARIGTKELESLATRACAAMSASPIEFGLVLANVEPDHDISFLAELTPLLSGLGRQLPLLWPVHREVYRALTNSPAARALKASRVSVIPEEGYAQILSLVRRARCLLGSGASDFAEEALALRIPTLPLTLDANLQDDSPTSADVPSTDKHSAASLAGILSDTPMAESDPEYWHTGTASRIAAYLVEWLPKSATDACGLAAIRKADASVEGNSPRLTATS